MLNSTDVNCQLQTLFSHGFYSSGNQIKINRRKLENSSSKLEGKFLSEGFVLSEGIDHPAIKNYIKDPFSSEHYEAVRDKFAAKYDKPDEDTSDDDDDSSDADDNEENGE